VPSSLPAMRTQYQAVNAAFSKQSLHFDTDDASNQVLQHMRSQVYEHVHKFIKPASSMLELNAGTGIDALHFASLGHRVHATDLSDGMIAEIEKKIQRNNLSHRFSCQQLSFDQLQHVKGHAFDYCFSNFGGLNCIDDLRNVTKLLPALLKPGAYVTWVVMPPVCLWELLSLLKGRTKKALRRFERNGTVSHLEGEHFVTYYHSLEYVKAAFQGHFTFITSEGLAALSPQPHRQDFPIARPKFYEGLRKIDAIVRTSFPFNRWADHIIVTFQYTPQKARV
jgi:ubiquinone/menaquinone biosynthesis C-methylase UbiE